MKIGQIVHDRGGTWIVAPCDPANLPPNLHAKRRKDVVSHIRLLSRCHLCWIGEATCSIDCYDEGFSEMLCGDCWEFIMRSCADDGPFRLTDVALLDLDEALNIRSKPTQKRWD